MRTLLTLKNKTILRDIVDARIASRTGRKATAFRRQRGHPFAVFANDYIGILVDQFGVYERDELALLFALIERLDEGVFSGTALDIGANVGNHACAFASRFACVFAFEPNPLVFQLLTFNAQFLPNMSVVNTELGDKPGKVQMKINNTNIGGSSICAKGDLEVTIDTVDTLVAAHDISCVTLIKIDVEGFEARVLEGAQETIRSNQPVICFEQSEHDFQNGTSEIIEFLRDRDYRFCWLEIGRRSWSTGLKRRFLTVCDLIFSSRNMIKIGDSPPPRFHSMIIAVPQRLRVSL